MEKYIVINQYGIGAAKGSVAYTPRSTRRKSYDACEAWCRENDTANTYAIVEQEEREVSKAAAALGHKGGSSKSDAKTAAARENGKKGGRPAQPKKEKR